ncbi:SRPBCC domain-containing protein [Leptospira mayottensis]|uniref:Activator of Hsp90 ATPase homologue 1/2-like C-terminal domain-containing protein n=2 Tax=Leptospira mayottensis TaxID=1137606 RepID=A0AA87MK85_9LEPT|nr:SRPBCC domain-containing protein [Leptospira mayottensis]AXR62593.1 ATPase [Leptospira mayottensis]AXR66511.1 ATPase [Leptospira mayottensis]AZQ03977.1 ATPase [Leptospira mayottensis 200901116]EKR98792.1 hypothetical protein LEP1GSC125_0309 [Leptospira mayottensis 200901122]TGN13306.1 ATPase [Leptospira mayottensis]
MKTNQKEVKIELRGETEIVFTRYFAARRELVFDCHTKPELMRRWLMGPEGMVLDTCEVDLKVGGKYLFVYADAKGNRFGIYGKFREVIVPEKVVNTENYAMDMSTFNSNAEEDPNAMVEARTFITEGDETLMTHTCKYSSAEMRTMALETNMVDGMGAFYQPLDKLLLEIV